MLNGSAIKFQLIICSTKRTRKSACSPNIYLKCHLLKNAPAYFPKYRNDVWFLILASIQEERFRNAPDINFMKKEPLGIATWESKDYIARNRYSSFLFPHTSLGNPILLNLVRLHWMSLGGVVKVFGFPSINGKQPIIHLLNRYKLYSFSLLTVRGKWGPPQRVNDHTWSG